MKWLPLILLTVLLDANSAVVDNPISAITPGVINPMVTQNNLMETVCKPKWTQSIRPPANYTTALKKRQLANGPYKNSLSASAFEEDHLISLELGGHPTDERNLWPQHYSKPFGAHEKDQVENWLHRRVCWGGLPLASAQQMVLTNWIAVYLLMKQGEQ